MNRPEYNDDVKYIIHSVDRKSVEISVDNIVGWDDNGETFVKNSKGQGSIKNFTNNIVFVSKARNIINSIKEEDGWNAKIYLEKKIKNPTKINTEWVQIFFQKLDFSSYSDFNNKLSLQLIAGELQSKISKYISEDFEVSRSTSVMNKPITKLVTNSMKHEEKRIFLSTKFKTDSRDTIVKLYNTIEKREAEGLISGIPMSIIESSDELINDVPGLDGLEFNHPDLQNQAPDSSIMFIYPSNVPQTRYRRLKFDLSFDFTRDREEDMIGSFFAVRLVKYKNEIEHEKTKNIYFEYDLGKISGTNIKISFDDVIESEQGSGWALVFHAHGKGDSGFFDKAYLNVLLENINLEGSITEDSRFESTQSKGLLIFDLIERGIEIITGEKLLYSKALTKGKFANTFISYGLWVRGFDVNNQTEDEIEFKDMKFSLQDLVDFCEAILGVSIGYQIINNKEYVVFEEYGYFNQNFTSIKLKDEVTVKRSVDKNILYKTAEVGSNKGGVYNEVVGLTEYNTFTKRTTPLDIGEKSYIKKTSIRRDSLASEITRRKQKKYFSTEDTDYDEDLMAYDCKKGLNNIYNQRLWQDDFIEEPKNIYSPETATNLRWSDTMCLLKQMAFIKPCLTYNNNDFMLFQESIGNSIMITNDGNIIDERANILIGSTDKEFHTSMKASFTHKINFNILNQIRGYTNVNGRMIPNLYGKIEYNEDGIIKHGRLISIKVKENKFELYEI